LLNKAVLFAHPVVSNYAVTHRMYTLKKLSELLAGEGDFRAAVRYGREALALRFSLKWLAYCVYLQLRAVNAPDRVDRKGNWYGTTD